MTLPAFAIDHGEPPPPGPPSYTLVLHRYVQGSDGHAWLVLRVTLPFVPFPGLSLYLPGSDYANDPEDWTQEILKHIAWNVAEGFFSSTLDHDTNDSFSLQEQLDYHQTFGWQLENLP